MVKAQGNLVEPGFTRSIHVQSVYQRLTSIAGVILLRDAEYRFCPIGSIAKNVVDRRDPRRIHHCIGEAIRERVFSMAHGQSARDDFDRLDHDSAFHTSVWNRSGD